MYAEAAKERQGVRTDLGDNNIPANSPECGEAREQAAKATPGRPTTTHCTEGSGIRQAEPVETDDEIAERPW